MLVPAYAATIHKSQGSEISRRDHPGAHPALRHAPAEPALYRRHARQKAGCTGRKKAVAIAIRNLWAWKQWSKLSEWLRPKPPVSRQFGMAS
jgi:exodeoxyribonuclease V alpha subunit